ncbi:MAG: GTP-binding protein [Lachnospiraceae bacterium]|nr:GTP-binding protein [Lachnospiraceae bacterium]
MIKIDIFSGFLGAGKTTLIKKLLADGYKGEKVVLIENEFGEIGIDGGFLKEAGVEITEMNSGCICCSLVGDFGEALVKVKEQFQPDRIIIEPSGVGKLSDVEKAVERIGDPDFVISGLTTVVDAGKCRIYMKNFGEFFNNQVEYAHTILLSRSQNVSEEKLQACVALLRSKNTEAVIVTTPWDELTGAQILEAMSTKVDLAKQLLEEEDICPECGHHHHDDEECCHEHHHHDDDDDDDDEHEHHHHHHDDDDDEHEHHHDDDDEHEHHHHHHDDDDDDDEEHEHHHHHHDGECSCGHDHHHHHADEVFTSWGRETPKKFDKDVLDDILDKLSDSEDYGIILRAKGIVPGTDGKWYHFDLTPGEYEIREGASDIIGRLCVIGSKLKEEEIAALFEV